ncbi:HD domain-containing phosphohydrolase [Pseudoalteromonas sp. G4]|uniref:HD domain-containing phosphohydrolase n=1 Tax=Pseudoalteromonas sp. G4 TaxID=2992761 RepID=UPI00237D3ECA|nr:HD domain-containing phosphohydrolase [Pseudoalteromonas sp. G4]
MMTDKLKMMIVDDEVEVLNALKRLFRKDYDVEIFSDPELAAQQLLETTYAVIVSDMKMPKMSGAELLSKACEICPDTPRILLTGYSDIDSTAMAINQGKINNYVSKPWSNDELKNVVLQAVEQFQLKQSVQRLEVELKLKNDLLRQQNLELESKVEERTLSLSKLNEKLKSANNRQRSLFYDVIEMINLIIEDTTGGGEGHVKRVASHCRMLAAALGLEKNQVTQVYLAGLMHEIGKVSLTDNLAKSIENELSRAELSEKQTHAVKGAEILQTVPHLKAIGTAVKHQYERFDGSGVPEHLIGSNIPIASRILTVVNEFDKLVLGRISKQKLSQQQAIEFLKKGRKTLFDPEVVDAYIQLLSSKVSLEQHNIDWCVGVNMLEPGMHLSQDLLNKQGAIVLTQGTEVTPAVIAKLKSYEKEWRYIFNIFVH